MNNELLRLLKRHTDALIKQKKTKPQEALVFKLSKQTDTLSFSPHISLSS